jgi:hypothetical protein
MVSKTQIQIGGGMWAIIYRAIEGRPIDVLAEKRLPNDEKEAIAFFEKHVFSHLHTLTSCVNILPECMDIRKALAEKIIPEADVNEALNKLFSYDPKVAIYNPKTGEVVATNFGHCRLGGRLWEVKLDDDSRENEIIDAIKSSCSWIGKGE